MIRLEGPDAAFIVAETPEWHFHVTALIVLDPGTGEDYSFERLRHNLEMRVHRTPQFRWKLHEDPTGMSRPTMADDPEFDIDNHINRIAVASPGDDRELTDLLGTLIAQKLDRSRPLWETWVIDGLEGGRVGMLTKVHHAIIDGTSGADLATILMDLEVNPDPDPEPPPYEPETLPSRWTRAAEGVGQVMSYPGKFARLGWQAVGMGRALVYGLLNDAAPSQPFSAPRTPFNGKLTPRRSLAWASLPMAEVTRVKDTFGVKTNDVVLAIVSGTLRRYLEALDELPEKSLVAQVPVSIRTEDTREKIGTQVAAMFTALASDVDDPAERLQTIAAETLKAKAMRREFDHHHHANITESFTPALIRSAARAWTVAGLDSLTPPVFNLIVSNVAGPPMDLFMAGGHVEAIYPLGPLLYGSGVNATVISNADRLDVGFLACPDLVPDVWDLAAEVEPALAELSEAAG